METIMDYKGRVVKITDIKAVPAGFVRPIMDTICQIEGCTNLQMYTIYKTFPDGAKKWLRVCQRHEKLIGNENLRRARRLKLKAVKTG